MKLLFSQVPKLKKLMFFDFRRLSIFLSALIINPWFSLNKTLTTSCSSICDKSIFNPILSLTKHISSKQVIIPPELIS